MTTNQEGHYKSPFAVPNLWYKSAFTLPEASEENLFRNADIELINHKDNQLVANLSNEFAQFDLDLQLPNLDSFEYGRLQDIDPPETSRAEDTDSALSSTGQFEEGQSVEDVWQLSIDEGAERPKLRTWEAFIAEEEGEDHEDKRMVYISEAGARVFDAALDRHAREGNAGHVLQSPFFLTCLGLLGVGRSSALFQWNRGKGTFKQTLLQVRLSGLSLVAAENVIQELGRVGGAFVRLRGFVERSYTAKAQLAARVALARCVQLILEVLEQELATSMPTAATLLELVGHFEISGAILQELLGLVMASKTAKSDLATIKAVQVKVQETAESCSPFHAIHLDILDRVSRPWLQEVSRKVGLTHGELDLLHLDSGATGLVSDEDERRISELSTGLDILEHSCPDHPLLNPAIWDIEQPDLHHASAFVDTGLILEKAKQYEASLMQAIGQYKTGVQPTMTQKSQSSTDCWGDECMAWEDNVQQQEYFVGIGNRFLQQPGQDSATSDSLPVNLRNLVTATVAHGRLPNIHDITANLEIPEQSGTPNPLHSLQPFLHAQSRLVNGSVLRLLFRQHNLRTHLNLQRSFYLFGNGTFTHLLSAALFDAPASSTSERQRDRVTRGESLGLRLDKREKWPPGGSELRLALMGILSEAHQQSASYEQNFSPQQTPNQRTSELPGNLSFSIRELPDTLIEQVMNPHSVFALDFLRLSYEAPRPLDVVLTPAILDRYDDIFRTLLRLLRMMHVTTALRYRILKTAISDVGNVQANEGALKAFSNENFHFVACLATYFFDTAIAVPWTTFSTHLDDLEKEMAAEESVEAGFGSRINIGIEGLRALHETCLTSMRTRLLLRAKQEPLRHRIESIFSRILEVWRRLLGDGPRATVSVAADSTILVAQADLDAMRIDIAAFLALLAEMVGKAGRSVKGKAERGDLLAAEMLRLKLDLQGFYGGV
ncbi:Spc98 family-domain-containing protein [Delphinella strobiligena]|nr:Spc98 family-domain-containing protein [Delphinella strobiligena]